MTGNQGPDPAKVDKLRDIALRRMANGPDPLLAEMAREVRSGRMTLREAATSWAYRDAFTDLAGQVLTRMNTTNREDLTKVDTDEDLDNLLARHDDDPDPQPEPEPPTSTRDDYDFNQPLATRTPPPPAVDPPPPTRARWQRRW